MMVKTRVEEPKGPKGSERRDAVSVCLVPGSAGDGVLRGGMGRWGWGRHRQQRIGGGVGVRSPQMGCASDVGCLASDRGEGHRPQCPRRQEVGVPQERGCHFPRDGGVRTFVSVLKQRVVCEKTSGPSFPQAPAGGLSTWSGWSCNQ